MSDFDDALQRLREISVELYSLANRVDDEFYGGGGIAHEIHMICAELDTIGVEIDLNREG